MPADRLLVTLLRNLQTHSNQQDTPRLLSTATSLFTTLSNPLNLTLLTAQLLAAPAIWTKPDGLRTCLRCIGVFQSAAVAILHQEQEKTELKRKNRFIPQQRQQQFSKLSREEWVKAIIRGADDRSPRWSHVMVLTGLLIGFEGQGRAGLSSTLRRTVEEALVAAINLALENVSSAEELDGQCVTLALNYSFDVLSDFQKTHLNYDKLLPVLIGTSFFSPEGYQSGYFLGRIDPEVTQNTDGKSSWSSSASSFTQIAALAARPLMTTIGPLSRVIAFSIEHVKGWQLISQILDDLSDFSRTLHDQWRHTRLSDVDAAQELTRFDQGTMETTLPVLWRLFRSILFSTSIILRAVLGRMLGDAKLAVAAVASHIASQSLLILRHFYFISARLSSTALSQHTFVCLSAIDILSTHPSMADDFVRAVQPATIGSIPSHALDRNLDLFFLNTAEHFALVLSPATNEDLLIASATPYLSAPVVDPECLKHNQSFLELFEAAHALTLAVLSSPQSADTTSKHLPFYIEALFRVFPRNLSARQFRMAFRTLLTICSPPGPLASSHPETAETLLEILHQRAWTQPSAPRPAPYTVPSTDSSNDATALAPRSPSDTVEASDGMEQRLEERTALTLTLIDCLSTLPPALLKDWLPLTADLLARIDGAADRQRCRERFWEVLTSGDMDVERSKVCVSWWGTHGGRDSVLLAGENGTGEDAALMSGAIEAYRANGRDSKL